MGNVFCLLGIVRIVSRRTFGRIRMGSCRSDSLPCSSVVSWSILLVVQVAM